MDAIERLLLFIESGLFSFSGFGSGIRQIFLISKEKLPMNVWQAHCDIVKCRPDSVSVSRIINRILTVIAQEL